MALGVEQYWLSIVATLLLASTSVLRVAGSQQFDSSFPNTVATATPSTFENFASEFSVFWGPDHVETTSSGNMLNLILTNDSGAGFGSRRAYLFGRINMNLKLIGGDSAGTVTTYYLSSTGDKHDELDFEFLGNQTGQPYILQTNVFASGVGEREQRIFLWFDPSEDFHSYSVLWNKNMIIFEVDGIPIRTFRNNEAIGLPYLNAQPMRVYSSLWNGDTWATEGGRIKVNWTYSPFVATFQNYNYDACEWTELGAPPCAALTAINWWEAEEYQALSDAQSAQLKKVQENYIVYDYCTDTTRWNITPPECATNLWLYDQSTSQSTIPSTNSMTGARAPSASQTLRSSSSDHAHWRGFPVVLFVCIVTFVTADHGGRMFWLHLSVLLHRGVLPWG